MRKGLSAGFPSPLSPYRLTIPANISLTVHYLLGFSVALSNSYGRGTGFSLLGPPQFKWQSSNKYSRNAIGKDFILRSGRRFKNGVKRCTICWGVHFRLIRQSILAAIGSCK